MAGYYIKSKCPSCEKDINCKNQFLSGIAEIKCPNCNEDIAIVCPYHEYEFYFLAALDQFIDDNYAESLFLLSKSRESFIEYIIGLFFYNYKKKTDFDIISKIKQSERLLGAFMAIYYFEFDDYYTPNNTVTKYRNDNTHTRKYPKKDEVVSYGEDLIKFLNDIIQKMLNKYDKQVISEYHASTQKEKIETKIGRKIYFELKNPIAWCKDHPIPKFEELISKIRNQNT